MELSESARLVLEHAQRERAGFDHRYLGVEHLFLGVVALDDAGLLECLAARRADLREVVRRVREAAGGEVYPDGEHLGLTLRARRVMAEAVRLAAAVRPEGGAGHDVWAPHILLAVLAEGRGLPARALASSGADLPALRASIRSLIATQGWAESAHRAPGTVEQVPAASVCSPPRAPEAQEGRPPANDPSGPEARFEIVAGPNDGFTFAFTGAGVVFEGEVLGPPPGSGLGPKDLDDVEVEVRADGTTLTCEVAFWLNGAEVSGAHLLREGDVVRVGMTEMMLVGHGAGAARAPVRRGGASRRKARRA